MSTSASQNLPARESSGNIPEIVAGLIIGFIEVIIAVSLASLVFSGNLSSHLPLGIAIVLMTAAIITLVISLMSSLTGTIASIQDNPAVLLAVAIAAIAPGIANEADLLPTVVMLITISTLLTGASIWLLAYFNLGDLVRYIPYPVIGGFLAGTGWLLMMGAIGTMADYPLTIATIPELIQPAQLIFWLPGIIFGLSLFFGLRWFRHFLALPLIIAIGLAGLYVWMFAVTTARADLSTEAFMIGSAGETSFVNPLPYYAIFQADWFAILQQSGNLAVIVIMTAITLLLNVSGIELHMKTDVDLNAELRAAGIANMISGALGGMIGFHALSMTVLSHRVGARRRLTGIVVAMLSVVLLILGSNIIGLIPKAIPGGILFFLGLDFLDEWLIQGWRKFSRIDFAVVMLILIAIATWGYLAGMGLGLALMVMIFVYKYSQIDIFHHQFSGAEVSSNIQRNLHHQNELKKLGQHIAIFELKGFIFFGTANRLLTLLRERIKAEHTAKLIYLVLDFRRVSGLDSSAAFSFSKINYLAEMHGFKVIITQITDTLWQDLLDNGLSEELATRYDNLDYGLEWCEEQLLESYEITTMHIPVTLQMQLQSFGFNREQIRELKTYLQRRTYKAGETIIHQGEDAHDLYFIELGRASVFLESGDSPPLRVQTLDMGTIVGEISFFLNEKRTASVIADMPVIAYQIDRQTQEQMKAQSPELTIAFNEVMLGIISNRLVNTNRELLALNR